MCLTNVRLFSSLRPLKQRYHPFGWQAQRRPGRDWHDASVAAAFIASVSTTSTNGAPANDMTFGQTVPITRPTSDSLAFGGNAVSNCRPSTVSSWRSLSLPIRVDTAAGPPEGEPSGSASSRFVAAVSTVEAASS